MIPLWHENTGNLRTMIHFHGCPVSGPRDVAQRFYRARHIMVSFAYPDHLPLVADVAQSFALDNGAFTTWKSGVKFDFHGYEKWVRQWHRHPGFAWHLIPDIIDGTEAENDKLLFSWPRQLVGGVPIWHLHESINRLRGLAGYYPMVALGSSGKYSIPGNEPWKERMAEAMSAITLDDGSPVVKLHGLRMLDPDIFRRYPFASADSTNAAVNGGANSRFGYYPHPLAAENANTIADRIEMHNSAAVWAQVDETPQILFSLT